MLRRAPRAGFKTKGAAEQRPFLSGWKVKVTVTLRSVCGVFRNRQCTRSDAEQGCLSKQSETNSDTGVGNLYSRRATSAGGGEYRLRARCLLFVETICVTTPAPQSRCFSVMPLGAMLENSIH